MLPSCTSTWIPGSILGGQGPDELDIVCPWYGFCARSMLAPRKANYVLWLLQYGWVARPTAHSTQDWRRMQSLAYVCPLVVLTLQLW